MRIRRLLGVLGGEPAPPALLARRTLEYSQRPPPHCAPDMLLAPQVLAPLDIVIDVGGSYSPADNRFDHHQRGFFETFDGEQGVVR